MNATEPAGTARTLDARDATWHGGMLDRYPVRSIDTGGAAWLMEHEAAAGTGPPMHIHEHEDELCYVIEGELASYRGEEQRTLSAGMAIWLPRAVAHTFKVTSPTARFLTFGLGGGFDQFFRDAGEPATELVIPPLPDGPTPQLIEACERFDVEIVGPPPA